MIFESILAENTVIKILGLAFIAVIIIAVIEISYRAEIMGDEEE